MLDLPMQRVLEEDVGRDVGLLRKKVRRNVVHQNVLPLVLARLKKQLPGNWCRCKSTPAGPVLTFFQRRILGRNGVPAAGNFSLRRSASCQVATVGASRRMRALSNSESTFSLTKAVRMSRAERGIPVSP